MKDILRSFVTSFLVAIMCTFVFTAYGTNNPITVFVITWNIVLFTWGIYLGSRRPWEK